MGNKKQSVETKKRKKKGRPSLLDLQKRSLRLQTQQQEQQQKQTNRNPNPNSRSSPNPYLKFPNRRSTRRNPNPNLDGTGDDDDDDDDEEEDSNGKRKEKKLKLVLRIPNGSDLGESGSDSDADGQGSRRKRKIDAVETARQNSNSKAMDEAPQGDPSDSGPTTALPDKKLLVFILDRLRKKDTYGVFSEPVDPEELPDYHDIIDNPMDFGTVRKKLYDGAYESLEQFESDVFLISSNAMRYNAPDTIYFRQARSIQELAKKDFENLRQESDDNEQEPKTVRRGRPPIKNVMKRIGRPPADRTGSDFSSDATLANARDGIHNSNSARDALRKGSSLDKPSATDSYRGSDQHRSDKNEEFSGSPLKGIPMRNWKKISVIDENRRNMHNQPLQSTCAREPSVFTAFEGERKLLMPVGLYMEHAYARSLARFAANLGPIGWEIAAKRIERVLPPGTKFGPGWVGESEVAHKFNPQLVSSLPHFSSQVKLSQGTVPTGGDLESRELASNNSALPPSTLASASVTTIRPVDSMNSTDSSRIGKHEGEIGLLGGGIHPKSPLQLCQNSTMQHQGNGFNPGHGLNHPSLAVKMTTQTRSPEVAMTHSHALDMVSRSRGNNSFGNHQAPSMQSDVGNSNATNSVSSLSDSNHNPEVQWRGGVSLNPKHGPIPPDLNADFHSLGSPVSGGLSDSKQKQKQPPPDLALQL